MGQAGTGSSGDRSRRRHTVGGQWQSRVSLRYRHLAWQAITQTTQPKTHNGRSSPLPVPRSLELVPVGEPTTQEVEQLTRT